MLRELERDGFVARAVYAEVPVRVEYTLTELGGTMCPVVRDLRTWAEVNSPAIGTARAAYDAAATR
jgi:DNA-binding HxlR family transcriptional regulator